MSFIFFQFCFANPSDSARLFKVINFKGWDSWRYLKGLLEKSSIFCKSKFTMVIKMGSLGNHQLVGLFSTWSWSFNPSPILDFLFSSLAIFSTKRRSSQKCKVVLVSGKGFFVDCRVFVDGNWISSFFFPKFHNSLFRGQRFTHFIRSCFFGRTFTACGRRITPIPPMICFSSKVHEQLPQTLLTQHHERRVFLWNFGGIFLNGCYCPYSWTNGIAMIFWDTISTLHKRGNFGIHKYAM